MTQIPQPQPSASSAASDGVILPGWVIKIAGPIVVAGLLGVWGFVWGLYTEQTALELRMALLENELQHIRSGVDRIEKAIQD